MIKEKKPNNDMDGILGLLKVKILKGVNLAIRDVNSSDPYVVVKLGKNKLKTRVIKNNVNPEWNEDLTLTVTDPTHPIIIRVYDKDTFSADDPMGDAEMDIQPLMDAVKMGYETIPDGTVIRKLTPSRKNCLAEESSIYWSRGCVTQDIVLRLKNVESGELELTLVWANPSKSKTF